LQGSHAASEWCSRLCHAAVSCAAAMAPISAAKIRIRPAKAGAQAAA
jgi:hypothetical protein